MSAGRIRHLRAGAKGPKSPAFRLPSRTAASSSSPRQARRSAPVSGSRPPSRPRPSSPTSAPTRWGSTPRGCVRSSTATTAGCTPLLRDQRALAGIGRAHANEILMARSCRRSRSRRKLDDEQIERLAAAIHEDLEARARAARAGQGRQGRLPRPPPARRALPHAAASRSRQVDYEEHTVFYCAACQTGGRVLKDRRMSRLLR